jgi:Transmembrane secretion effector
VSERELVAADSISAIVGMVAAVVGGGCAALLAGPGPVMALAIAAGLHFASAAMFSRSAADFGGGQMPSSEDGSVLHDLVVGCRELLSHTKVRRAVVTVCVHRFLLAAAVVVFALVADSQFEIEAAGYALALGAVAFGSFLGTLVVSTFVRKIGRDRVLAGSFLLAACFSMLAAASHSAQVIIGCVGGLGFAFQLARVLTDAVVQGAIPDGSMGRAFAVYDITYTLAFVSAGLSIVPLWSLVSPAGLLGAIGSAYFLAAATLAVSRAAAARRFIGQGDQDCSTSVS